jgi:hypothetical protein
VRLVGPLPRPDYVSMTIHKHFIILSIAAISPANDNLRRIVTYANLEPFKRRRMQRPRSSYEGQTAPR